jgi:hypothetical protein
MFTQLLDLYKQKGRSNLQQQHPEFFDFLVETTSFLSHDVSTTQRLWHHWNHQFSIPLCQTCNHSPVHWDATITSYRKYCSRNCTPKPKTPPSLNRCLCPICNTPFIKTPIRTTCSKQCRREFVSRENCKPPIEIGELQEWIREFLARVGDSGLQGFSTKYIHQFNSIQHYTKDLASSVQVRRRMKFILSYQELIAKASIPLEDAIRMKYQSVVCPRCRVNERPINLKTRRLKKWCRQCEMLAEEEKLKPKPPKGVRPPPPNKNTDTRLNTPDWLFEQHHVHKKTKQQISVMLGVDKETVTNRFKQFGIQSIKHRFLTNQQTEVVDFVRSLGISNIEENNRKLCPPKQIDIFLPDHNLAIEYCGLYWHSTSQERITPSYHKQKMDKCAVRGVRLLTIFSDEWLQRRTICEGKIASILQLSTSDRVYARECQVVSVQAKEKKAFFNQHHIQGNGPSSFQLGLRSPTGELVAVMAFIQTDSEIILNRYASSCIVNGGFSKLLSHAIRQNLNWKRIVSFADLRWSEGNVYQKNGFTLEGIIPPDYAYTKGQERIHKFNFRHAHLQRRLGNLYDPTKSESENMLNAGWHKIFDCGKQRWVLNLEK